jgi:hypothetical protein
MTLLAIAFYNAQGDIHQVGILSDSDWNFAPVQHFTASRGFSDVQVVGDINRADINMYNSATGMELYGQMYPNVWLGNPVAIQAGWTHVVRHGFGILYYRASDGFAKVNSLSSDYQLGSGWQHAVSTHWGILFLRSDGFAKLGKFEFRQTGNGPFGNLELTGFSLETAVLNVGAHWTHVIGTVDYLMLYNSHDGTYSVGRLENTNSETAVFVPLRTNWETLLNLPAATRQIEANWTHLIELNDNYVFLYRQLADSGQVAKLGKQPWRSGRSPAIGLSSIFTPIRTYPNGTFITATHIAAGVVYPNIR